MITVDALLTTPELKNLRVLAGHNGLNREINSISVMDAPDSYKWLKGREFILTTGFIFGGDDWQVEHFVNNLIEAGCSAVGIKKGRFLKSIPETVIKLANQNQFPVIEIPYSFGWSDIISEFYRLQYENNSISKEAMSPVAVGEQVTKNNDEFYCGFLTRLHSGIITASDIHRFDKHRKDDNTSNFCIALVRGISGEIILNNIQSVLNDPRLAKKFIVNTHTVSVETEHTIIILLEIRSTGDEPFEKWQHSLVEALDYYLDETDNGSISIGRIYSDADGILKSYSEAVESHNIGSVILKDKRCYFYHILSAYCTLQNTDLSRIDLGYIKILEDNYGKLGFDGIECLEVYLEYGYKIAASKLFLHKNTLRYRIQKISDLLQLDLNDRINCNTLLMQMKLWRLSKGSLE